MPGTAEEARLLLEELQRRGLSLPGGEESGLRQLALAATTGFVEGLPVVGPALEAGTAHARAGLGALLGGGTYEDELAATRDRAAQARETHPWIHGGAQIVGGVAGMAAPVSAAPRLMGAAGSLGQRMLAGAGSGGAIGAADSAVRGGDPLVGGALGAAGGAGGAYLGDRLSTFFGRFKSAPSAEVLRAQAKPFFEQSRAAGVVIRGDRYAGMVDDLASTLRSSGLDPDLHPLATRTLARLQNRAADAVDFEQVHIARQLVNDLSKSTVEGERRLGGIMARQIDAWMNTLQPGDVLAGDPRTAASALQTGKGLWHRMKRAEIIEDALDRSELMISGGQDPATAFRVRFRQIYNNPELRRQFTPEQVAEIRKVAEGGPLSRMINWITSLHAATVGGSAVAGATYVGGPVAGAATGAGVLAARSGARALRATEARRLAEGARQMAAHGTIKPMVPSATAARAGATAGLGAGTIAARAATPRPDPEEARRKALARVLKAR